MGKGCCTGIRFNFAHCPYELPPRKQSVNAKLVNKLFSKLDEKLAQKHKGITAFSCPLRDNLKSHSHPKLYHLSLHCGHSELQGQHQL